MAYWLDSDKVDLEKFLDVTVIEGKLNLYQKVSTTGPHGLVTCMDSLVMLLTWIGSNDQFDKEMVKSTKVGHIRRYCPHAAERRTCFFCDERGHSKSQCPQHVSSLWPDRG